MPKKKTKQVVETNVEEKQWGFDDYYNIVTVQVFEPFEDGDRVRVTIEKIGDDK